MRGEYLILDGETNISVSLGNLKLFAEELYAKIKANFVEKGDIFYTENEEIDNITNKM